VAKSRGTVARKLLLKNHLLYGPMRDGRDCYVKRDVRLRLIHAALMLPLVLTGCGGGGEDNGSGTPVAVAPAPTPAPSPAPSPTPSAPAPTPSPSPSPTPSVAIPAAPPRPTSWAAGAAALYAGGSAPNVPACQAGTLAQAVKDDVLLRMNAVRALHGLAPVTYNSADDAQVMQSSLMMAANGALDHTPPNTWKCWTQTGYDGSSSSNLYGGTISPYLIWSSEDDFIGGWLTEVNNLLVDNVGHRRWMLDPFLTKIAYGRVAQVLSDGSRTDAATLKVFNFAGGSPAPSTVPAYVAYPQGDYPARWFDTRALLSFTVVANPASRGASANASVSFSGATITVRDPSGTSLGVSSVSFDNVGYGVPNNLQWKVAGLQQNVRYQVTIAGVVVSGATRSYDYSFRIVP
jgi:uncharacterized protein YkwD